MALSAKQHTDDRNSLPTEAHNRWLDAFFLWYYSGKLHHIIDLLSQGIELSPKNSRFLAAILRRTVRPLSGKRAGRYRYKQAIIDLTIRDMIDRRKSRKQIRDELIKKGLVDSRQFSQAGLDQRIDRGAITKIDSVEAFSKEYERESDN